MISVTSIEIAILPKILVTYQVESKAHPSFVRFDFQPWNWSPIDLVLYLVDHDDVVVRHVVHHHHVMISAEGNVVASEVVDRVLLELFLLKKKGLNVSAAGWEICSVEGKRTIDDSTPWKWFLWFTFYYTDIEGKLRLGWPSKTDDEVKCQAVEDNPSASTRHLLAPALGAC